MVVINLFIGVISLAMFTAFDDLQVSERPPETNI